MTCFAVSSANSNVCFYPKESSLIIHLQWRIWFLAFHFLIGAMVPAPTSPHSHPRSLQKDALSPLLSKRSSIRFLHF